MSTVTTSWELLTKCQIRSPSSRIAVEKLPWLPTDFISSQHTMICSMGKHSTPCGQFIPLPKPSKELTRLNATKKSIYPSEFHFKRASLGFLKNIILESCRRDLWRSLLQHLIYILVKKHLLCRSKQILHIWCSCILLWAMELLSFAGPAIGTFMWFQFLKFWAKYRKNRMISLPLCKS